MYFKVLFLFSYVFLTDAAYEGEQCVKDGTAGVCTNLNRCQTAIQDIRNRKNPQLCSFDNTDPIVCCLDARPARGNPPVATTTKRPSVASTIEDEPIYDSESDQCEPIATDLTVPKTGQKAFDKCIEYQEYVYPCERSMGELNRSNRCHHNVDQLIVGGTDAAQYEFPHMVMVGYGEKIEDVTYRCGGALITDRFILTAGHCSASYLGPITYVLVGALRRSDVADRSKIYKVKNNIKHPEYRARKKYNDIALVETENRIKLNQFVVPACLHTGDPVNDEKVLATGWGLTAYRGATSEVLQKVTLHKFSTWECMQKKEGLNAQSQTCYGDHQISRDTCRGDSGGPLQIKNKKISCMYTVVGVTSYGSACGFVGEPGIYTRVANYIPWIESIVWP